MVYKGQPFEPALLDAMEEEIRFLAKNTIWSAVYKNISSLTNFYKNQRSIYSDDYSFSTIRFVQDPQNGDMNDWPLPSGDVSVKSFSGLQDFIENASAKNTYYQEMVRMGEVALAQGGVTEEDKKAFSKTAQAARTTIAREVNQQIAPINAVYDETYEAVKFMRDYFSNIQSAINLNIIQLDMELKSPNSIMPSLVNKSYLYNLQQRLANFSSEKLNVHLKALNEQLESLKEIKGLDHSIHYKESAEENAQNNLYQPGFGFGHGFVADQVYLSTLKIKGQEAFLNTSFLEKSRQRAETDITALEESLNVFSSNLQLLSAYFDPKGLGKQYTIKEPVLRTILYQSFERPYVVYPKALSLSLERTPGQRANLNDDILTAIAESPEYAKYKKEFDSIVETELKTMGGITESAFTAICGMLGEAEESVNQRVNEKNLPIYSVLENNQIMAGYFLKHCREMKERKETLPTGIAERYENLEQNLYEVISKLDSVLPYAKFTPYQSNDDVVDNPMGTLNNYYYMKRLSEEREEFEPLPALPSILGNMRSPSITPPISLTYNRFSIRENISAVPYFDALIYPSGFIKPGSMGDNGGRGKK